MRIACAISGAKIKPRPGRLALSRPPRLRDTPMRRHIFIFFVA
jgi:hypothetical protein